MNDLGITTIHTAPNDRIVVYFSTRSLYNVLPAAYNSLLAFTPNVHVYCFIEDDTLPYPTPPQVTCVNVSEQTIFPPTGPCYRTKYTYMILLKAAVTKIFPDADKVLLLDVDTIVCDDLSPLWDIDLSMAYYAAVREPRTSMSRGVPYANFGVVMLNLAKLRADDMDDAIIHDLNTRTFAYPEQDAFAYRCTHHWDPIDPSYNVTKQTFDITGNPSRTIILHYAGINDWSNVGPVQYWLNHTTPYPRYVVYAGDHRVYNMMLASAKSLLAHAPVDRIFFLIEHDTFPQPLPPVFTCINVANQDVFPHDGPNIMQWYSFMTTLRAGLTRILPDNIDRILWLDPDTVVVDDISDLWNTDITNAYFAGVEEVRNNDHTLHPYINAGVMLMNLHKFRKDGMDERVINEINTVPYKHLEQDVLNYLCFTHVRRLPSCYSDSFVSEPTHHPKIKHFLAHAKPQFYTEVAPYERMTFDELMSIQSHLKAGELCERR